MNPSRRRQCVRSFESLESRALLAVGVAGQIHALATTTTKATNQAFVDQLFTVVLGRSAGTTELNNIMSRLDSGKLTRRELSLGVLNSKEDLTNLVNQQYQTVFGTTPTDRQLNAGIHFLASSHGSLNGLTARLYGEKAFRTDQSITNNTEFVDRVAGDSGITLTTAQTNKLVNQLDSGQETSTQVAEAMLGSRQSLQNQIDSLHNDYFSGTATTAEINSAFATIRQGNRWGLRMAMIASPRFVP